MQQLCRVYSTEQLLLLLLGEQLWRMLCSMWGSSAVHHTENYLDAELQYSISHLTSQNLSGRHEILMNITQYDF